MFSKETITTSTGTSWEEINRLKNEIQKADAILIGAGAGLSTSAGLVYTGQRFTRHFSDFRDQYGIEDMYSGGFYPYDTPEEYWAWWSRHIWLNRYAAEPGKTYTELLEIVRNKDCFVLTTNVDHQFQKAGFDKLRLFYTQGDYGLWQCVHGCQSKTYDNKEQVKTMVERQKNMKIPSELIPRCPLCGEPMTMNLRVDDHFVQDAGWYAACGRYEAFLQKHETGRVLYLELGVGGNTPGIIKYPFWKMTARNPDAVYACVNQGEAFCPPELKERSICVNQDIQSVVDAL